MTETQTETGGRDLALAVVKHDFKIDFEITRKRFKRWVASRRLPTVKEVALGTFYSLAIPLMRGVGFQFFLVGMANAFSAPLPSTDALFFVDCGGFRPLAESFLIKGSMERTRNLAIMSACNKCITFVMKEGKEDVQTSMVAGFGFGVALSLVTGLSGPRIMSVGVMCALFNVWRFKSDMVL